ncbi:MAG TPA: hypothetical protein VHE55_19455 [Fimbriimonadaceae bacterium]|nr:hypothetical protein [Fimbriimonadaceae bacterium]
MFNLPYLEVPLITLPDGSVRVCGTQVLLEQIATEFEDGSSAEEIADRHERLRLSDVYLVLSFILKRRKEVEDYLELRRSMDPSERMRPRPAA